MASAPHGFDPSLYNRLDQCIRGRHYFRRHGDVWACVDCDTKAPQQPGVPASGESAGPLAREMLRIGDGS